MTCTGIAVRNFRNIEQAEVRFDDGINVLVGENAQGKTNLLEAIFYVSVGKSFRVNHASEILRFGEEQAQISLNFRDSIREQNITMRIFRDKARQVEINRVRVSKLSDIVGSFRAVLFCPEHLSLIKDGPAMRRHYMDVAISRLYPAYMRTLQRYGTILKQRNALIRDAYKNRDVFDSTIELWSLQLAHEAAVISKYRSAFLARTDQKVKTCFVEMMGEKELPEVMYVASCRGDGMDFDNVQQTEERYISLLTSSYDREIAMGGTLWGIHKDDMDIRLNGKSARLYGSQGQQRSLSLALKLAEGEICFDEYGDHPVYLFDDVLSELDVHRRRFLLERIRDKQVIMTCCENHELRGASVITVSGGRYRR